jgi:hypothetical protein
MIQQGITVGHHINPDTVEESRAHSATDRSCVHRWRDFESGVGAVQARKKGKAETHTPHRQKATGTISMHQRKTRVGARFRRVISSEFDGVRVQLRGAMVVGAWSWRVFEASRQNGACSC